MQSMSVAEVSGYGGESGAVSAPSARERSCSPTPRQQLLESWKTRCFQNTNGRKRVDVLPATTEPPPALTLARGDAWLTVPFELRWRTIVCHTTTAALA